MADSQALRTPGGSPTAYARKKYGYKDTGEFPIFDKESATAALKLRGHANSADERAWIILRAAHYAPEEAKAAREADKQ